MPCFKIDLTRAAMQYRFVTHVVTYPLPMPVISTLPLMPPTPIFMQPVSANTWTLLLPRIRGLPYLGQFSFRDAIRSEKKQETSSSTALAPLRWLSTPT